MDNAALRKRMIAKRKALSEAAVKAKSEQICTRCLPYLRDAKTVGIYWSVNNEVDVTSLLKQTENNRIFALPRVISDTEMEMIRWHPNMAMKRSAFGILEPLSTEVVAAMDFDVLFIPLVAFRDDGARLGYGGGYYDRYLRNCSALKIGIAYAFQRCDQWQEKPHDQRMDVVITETECITGKHCP